MDYQLGIIAIDYDQKVLDVCLLTGSKFPCQNEVSILHDPRR